jgi:tetratricopeptide (TPR) repeat protein
LSLGLAAVPRAFAQPAPVAPAPEPAPAASSPPVQSEPDGAASVPTAEAGVDEARLVEAKQHFLQGVAYSDAGNCSAAIVEWQAAYAIVPRPNALYNIAQCQERLFRYDLAIRDYKRYLSEAEADAPDRPAVEAALRTLANLLGILHVASNVPAEVWIDDRLGGEAPGDVFVPAGTHSVELRAEGYLPKRFEVQLVGREERAIEIELSRAQTTVQVTETTGNDPTLFWIGVGATGLAAAVGGYFALHALSIHDEALELPETHPSRSKKREQVEDAELTADIFFGSAALLAVGTTIVFFVTDWDAGERPSYAEPEAALRVLPVFGKGAAGVALRGQL